MPSALVTKDLATVLEKVLEVGKFYAVDLPNIFWLKSEIHNWYTTWKTEAKVHGLSALPSCLSSTLPRISGFYPNIQALVTILCTLRVTSCGVERSFSGLKCIKTHLRSSMDNERLSSLALLHMHQDTPEEVINELFRCHPRRLQLWDRCWWLCLFSWTLFTNTSESSCSPSSTMTNVDSSLCTNSIWVSLDGSHSLTSIRYSCIKPHEITCKPYIHKS